MTKDIYIPGLYVIENFISEEEGEHLLAHIDYWDRKNVDKKKNETEEKDNKTKDEDEGEEEELKRFVWRENLSRRVQHYGYEFSYETKNVDTSKHMGPLPSLVTPLTKRMEEWCTTTGCPFFRKTEDWDQLTINEYLPGQG